MDAPDTAVSFGHLLVTKTKSLAQFPEMGREVPEFGNASLREIIVKSYRVIYRVTHGQQRVEIIRFWHAARGTPKLEH